MNRNSLSTSVHVNITLPKKPLALKACFIILLVPSLIVVKLDRLFKIGNVGTDFEVNDAEHPVPDTTTKAKFPSNTSFVWTSLLSNAFGVDNDPMSTAGCLSRYGWSELFSNCFSRTRV